MEARQLRCFPPEDEAFCAAVRRCAGAFGDLASPGAAFGDYLRSALLSAYPGVIVVEQDPLASFDPERPLFYVYRDGVPSHELTMEPSL